MRSFDEGSGALAERPAPRDEARPGARGSSAIAGRLPLVAAALALPAAAPLFGPGLIAAHRYGDSPFLLVRVVALLEGLRRGELFPRWSPDLAYGLGYPFFDFYGALAFYVAALLHLAGLPIVEAVKATQLAGFLLCSLAMFGFARRHLGDAGGLVAAAAYGYAPYHLVNVYARGDSLGEFTAMALLPLVLSALERAVAGSPAGALALAGALAALVLAHNLSALLALPLIALWGLLCLARDVSSLSLWERVRVRASPGAPGGVEPRPAGTPSPGTRRGIYRGALLVLGGGVLALGLTCFYWLPALWDRRYVHLEHVTTGYFDFRNHFVGVARLVQPSLRYDYGLDGTADGALPFELGLAQALLAVAGLLAIPWLLRCRRAWPIAGLALAAAAGYLFLLTPLSRPLWEGVATLQVVQFPWRALAGASFGLALLAGLPALALQGWARALWMGAAVLVAAAAGSFGATPERWRIPPEDVNVAGVERYEYLTSSIGSTVRYEYLPLEAKERPWTSGRMLEGAALPRVRAAPGMSATVRREPGPAFVVDVRSAQGGSLGLEQHFFPGWRASLPLRASDPEGFLTVDVPPGDQTVRFEFADTRLRRVAGLVSLASLGLVTALIVLGRRRKRAPERGDGASAAARDADPDPGRLPGRLGLAVAVASLALFAARVPWSELARPSPSDGWDHRFTHAHAPWPYVEPDGVSVGIAIAGPRVVGYRQREEVVAGERQRIELAIEGGTGAGLEARVFHPAEPIVDGSRTIAGAVLTGPVAELEIPLGTPPGLYQVQVYVPWRGGHDVFLAPFRVLPARLPPPAAGRPLADFGGQLGLEALELEPFATVERPAVRLRWRALGRPEDDWRVSLRLVDDDGNLWGSRDGRPADGFYPTPLWPADAVVDERRDLPALAGTPPGPYRLEVRVYSLAGRTLDVLDAGGAPVAPLYRSEPITLPPSPGRMPAPAGAPPLALVESSVGAREVDAGGRVPLSLLWQAAAAPGRDLEVWLALGPAEARFPAGGGFPASRWRAGELVRDQHRLLVPPELAAGRQPLRVALVEPGTATAVLGPIDLGEIQVRGRPRRFDPPAPQQAVGALFGGAIELVGYDLPSARVAPGGRLPLTLWWRAGARVETSYTVFVHLLDAERRVRGQVDRVPGGGALPTSGWALGEVVEDRYEVPLDPIAPPGAYLLEVGLYDARSGQRLRLADGADHLVLAEMPAP
ncbi:MAG TPA: hypothetical protein VG370_03650 [Chloroflexota bacterium]|nr:hypothetical protein [Chloroflexota bacterium]